jgi:hypothetical protein
MSYGADFRVRSPLGGLLLLLALHGCSGSPPEDQLPSEPGEATVWVGPAGVLLGRDQVVRFPGGEMRVRERYRFP